MNASLTARWRQIAHHPLTRWVGLIFMAALLTFVAWVIYREREIVVTRLLDVKPWQLLGVAGWYTLDQAIYVLGWLALMHSLAGSGHIQTHACVYEVANAAKRLPGLPWHIGGRALLYEQVGIEARPVLIASGLEWVLCWLSGALMGGPFLAVIFPSLRWPALILSAGLWGLLAPPVLRRVLARTVQGWTDAHVSLGHIYGWLLIYASGWLFGGVLCFWILSIFQPLVWAQLPVVVGSWTISGALSLLMVIMPTNFGITEISLTALLSHLAPIAIAGLTAISIRIFITVLDLLYGALFWLLLRRSAHG